MGENQRRTISKNDDNIAALRGRYPDGLHFTVGDLHGETDTLIELMDKIRFDPKKDHVYFVGDYNAGRDVESLLRYMSKYYQPDHEAPGFHMIRGNHERHLFPEYRLENLPDALVVRGSYLNFFITHAGMVSEAFELFRRDMSKAPDRRVFAYRLMDDVCRYGAPLGMLTWSRRGLYTRSSGRYVWPPEDVLRENRACVIHGHAPYCFFVGENADPYGRNNLFWEKQHVWFCEDLRSFNLDSNIKGRHVNGESYRGLACLCMEVYDRLAADNDGQLTVDLLCTAENGIFSKEISSARQTVTDGDLDALLDARPDMKTVITDHRGKLLILDRSENWRDEWPFVIDLRRGK